ncbi:MAG: 50S ribosomal protein L18 [Planctomycetota bacterium]|jgi:large subunit ribosomal protein L18
MNREKSIQKQRQRRSYRVRNRLRGDAERPRLCVFRSHRHIYAQLIDDEAGRTLCSAASRPGAQYGGTVDAAKAVGNALAEKAMAINIKQVRFDRGPYKYHGRVRALADAAREKGLEF